MGKQKSTKTSYEFDSYNFVEEVFRCLGLTIKSSSPGPDDNVDNVVFNFTSSSLDTRALFSALSKNLITKACDDGSSGTVNLPSGNFRLDSSVEPPTVPFSSLCDDISFNFDEISTSESTHALSLSQMSYRFLLQMKSDISLSRITDFPHCLRLKDAIREDLAIGGILLFSAEISSVEDSRLSCFTSNISFINSHMCSDNLTRNALPKTWKNLSTTPPESLSELLDEVAMSISEFWTNSQQDSIAESQTTVLLQHISHDLISYFAARAAKAGGTFNQGKKMTETALNVLEDWRLLCHQLVTIDWAGSWTKTLEDINLKKVKERLKTIVSIYLLHEELLELLTPHEFNSFRVANIWDSFSNVNPFDLSMEAQKAWDEASRSFFRRLEPLEHHCAIFLREILSQSANQSPQAILMESSRFSQLLNRPIIAQELISERDSLLGKLTERIQNIRLEFEQRIQMSSENILDDQNGHLGKHIPNTVNKIIWLRQLISRMDEAIRMGRTMLHDLPAASHFFSNTMQLHQEIQDFEQESFNNWVFDVKDAAPDLMLDSNTPLMNVDSKGKICVNFPERLVSLLREVRIFSSLGYRIPHEIQRIYDSGIKYFDNAISLAQVASAYNFMDQDIIYSTRAMLLEAAMTFESIVVADDDRKLTWRNTHDAEAYIEQLRKASKSLGSQNRHLHRLHNEIKELVLTLFNISLLHSNESWMEVVYRIQQKITESHFSNTESWKRFWDMQIYKAMEHQYQLGLESLHRTITGLRADVIYDSKNGWLALRPPLESLQEMYFSKVHQFLTLPLRFRGVGDNDFFRYMLEKNKASIFSVMQHGTNLFRRIPKELKRMESLVILGQCDRNGNLSLEKIISESLTEVQHWEQSIRLLKQKGKEAAAIELFIKVDCITLCTAVIKGTVEEHLSRLADALNVTLRKSAEKHITTINNFISQANQSLNNQAQNVDEITQMNLLHAELIEKRPEIEVEFYHFYNKNKLLQSMTNTPGLDFAKTMKNWESFVLRLESHESEMEGRLTHMKEMLEENVKVVSRDFERFIARWNETKPKHWKQDNGYDYTHKQAEEYQSLKRRFTDLQKQCKVFNVEELNEEEYNGIEMEINETKEIWASLQQFQEQLNSLRNEKWIAFRSKTYRFEDFIKNWSETLKILPAAPVVVELRTQLNDWSQCAPLLKFIRGDCFTSLHWSELFHLLHIHDQTQDSVSVGDIIDQYEFILKSELDIKKLNSQAQAEAQIREALDDIRAWVNESKLSLIPHSERQDVMLITGWKEIITALADNQSLLFSTKDSPFFSEMATTIAEWEERFSILDFIIHHLHTIQRKWVYLEPIFSRGALSSEQKRFSKLDKEYIAIMKNIGQDPRLSTLGNRVEYKERLSEILNQLETCQKALNTFLEVKRDSFPRFYFISDDDLLEILGQGNNPSVIQSHLKKLFMGIHSVVFNSSKDKVTQVLSMDGEIVVLIKPVSVTNVVEEWLSELDKCVKKTLQENLINCLSSTNIMYYSSQILCISEQIHFNTRVLEAIALSGENGLNNYRTTVQQQIQELTTASSTNTDSVIEFKLKSLILDSIHNMDILDSLIKQKVTTTDDWHWIKNLRYRLKDKQKCEIAMVDASFLYSYEYQGNAPKLVHTPLTDTCYLTLTQGMHLGYGGNPYGPAGTGKTESVKALGSALGRQVLVFNCDEGIDFKSMGRIFIGLVKCGAWGCFDEFNRLKIDQLSAVSQMIQSIQEALKNGEPTCSLLGREVPINENAGIFVTLNPAGKGYGGRSQLPDNLKQLFRAVAMSVPDDEIITQTILASEGFQYSKKLAKSFVEIYYFSRQLLSPQRHYDWGLRAMKSVLRLGGSLIRQYLREQISNREKVNEDIEKIEASILIKSLRMNTLSKLTYNDSALFNRLVADIFPDVAIDEINYAEMRLAIEAEITRMKLQVNSKQIEKILQLYEALQQRMGVALVGPSGCGKSTLFQILKNTLNRLGRHVNSYIMNPKAMPRPQLLGYMDQDTREWYDGVLTEASKKVVREPKEVHSWIICDGDIDPEWVESLNSVLDDNRLLTMPNGVRIPFDNNVNFIFETHSLEFASPATVSRLGMIFLSEDDLSPQMLVESWLQSLDSDEIRDLLRDWIDQYFYQAIDSLLSHHLIVPQAKISYVSPGLTQLRCCTSKSEFAVGIIYGLGSFLCESERVEFAKTIFSNMNISIPDIRVPLNYYIPEGEVCFTAYQYESLLEDEAFDLFQYPMISTIDCQRNCEIMRLWIKHHIGNTYRSFFLIGPEGCGKMMLLMNAFSNESGCKIVLVNCSAYTAAEQVIYKLKQSCTVFNTPNGRILRPQGAEYLVLIIKDLNLPHPDTYGTVQLHSFLQQLISYKGFYDSDLEWVAVERVQVVGTMNPPGSMGRYAVSPRLLSLVSVLVIDYPPFNSLQIIYSEFLNVVAKSSEFKLDMTGKNVNDISKAMLSVYEWIRNEYTIDDAFHYLFTPRDLTQWILNLLHYEAAGLSDALTYECLRIFSDRLRTPEERKRLQNTVNLKFAFLTASAKSDSSLNSFYVSWLDPNPSFPKKLLQITFDDAKKIVEKSLISYAREYNVLQLHAIPEMIEWIAKIDRLISQHSGHAFLVGQIGTGGADMVRLVAYINHIELFSLGLTPDYGKKSFYTDIKNAIIRSLAEGGTPVVLLLEEHCFFNPDFLVFINSLLNSGDVSGLFSSEEYESIVNPLKEYALLEGVSVSNYLVSLVRRYLHICVCMDYKNSFYEKRCLSNPALLTNTTIMWLGTWYSDSMKLLPRCLMPEVFEALSKREDKKKFSLTTELVFFHRFFGEKFTPQHFLTLCDTYHKLFESKSVTALEKLSRLKQGLEKIEEAEKAVDKISAEVTERKAEMELKQKEADEALQQIQRKMEESGDQKKEISKIQESIDAEQKAIEERKLIIEEKLGVIKPTLDAARDAVDSIRAEHLSELKSLKSPPLAVQDVMEGVMRLLTPGGDTSWAGIRKWLTGDIKGLILNFDISKLSIHDRAPVEQYITSKTNSFKKDVIGRASKAAAPMCEWLKAVLKYSLVLETVQPMLDELEKYEVNIKEGCKRREKYEEHRKKIESKVEELKSKFSSKTKEAERLRTKLEKVEGVLQNASELLSKLGGEKSRWNSQLSEMQENSLLMPKLNLLASAVIVYMGQEAEDVRHDTIKNWCDRLEISVFHFFTYLRTESTILKYKAEGLPSDDLSLDNAVMILEQIRTPLIIDPAGQALIWLVQNLKESNNTVEMCSILDPRLLSLFELAIRFGKKFIITDVDEIKPWIFPILRKELKSDGTKKMIQIGDRRSIDYADGFQLYLFTRSTDLNIPPNALSFLTEINFTVTRSGLKSQLLGLTLQYEQPQLEEEKIRILQKEEELKINLSALEESLLHDLAASTGSLLENASLIESLNKIKSQANEITDALNKSKELKDDIDSKRNVYQSLAITGSFLFFLLSDLRILSHMYHFSLNSFLDLFKSALITHKDELLDPSEKISSFRKTLIQNFVIAISRGLFREHRLVFGLHLIHTLESHIFKVNEWSYLTGCSLVSSPKTEEMTVPLWVPTDVKMNYKKFVSLFPELTQSIRLHEADIWWQWMSNPTPESSYPPNAHKLTDLQKLLLLKTLRPDRLIAPLTSWTCETLGIESLDEFRTLSSLISTTKPSEPILLITTTGTDPSHELQEVAYRIVGKESFFQLAMGGGQMDEAMRLLHHCAEKGGWLFLKNLHLVISWVSTLGKTLSSLAFHADFRLFLTTESHPEFPTVLLSNCLKVSVQAPPGIRQNLKRTFNLREAVDFESFSLLQSQMLFVISWLHAIVQERRSYIPQGWAKFYEFSQADLNAASDVVLNQLTPSQVNWATIHGVLKYAIYGARMETSYDLRILEQYLLGFFREEILSRSENQEPLFAKISLPNSNKLSVYHSILDKLNPVDPPGIFNLPPNADRVLQISRVDLLDSNLRRIHEEVKVESLSREEWIKRITPIIEKWLDLTRPHANLLTSSAIFSLNTELLKPVAEFLNTESQNALYLLRKVDSHISALKSIVEGKSLITESCREEATSMINDTVPVSWGGFFHGPEDIYRWLSSLVQRSVGLLELTTTMNTNAFLKAPLNLNTLLRPQTFFSALRQETAHITGIPMGELSLITQFNHPLEDTPLNITISGLLLQGATLDEGNPGYLSVISAPDAPGYIEIPHLFTSWDKASKQVKDTVAVPVYTNSSKEIIVAEFNLPVRKSEDVKTFMMAGISIMLDQ